MNLSILIPVFNNLEYTKKCLNSITNIIQNNECGFEYKIVVIDDGSTDGTSEWVRLKYPDVYVLNGDGNLWWSGAINKGVKYSLEILNSEFVLWWNNDIYPESNYFKNLEEILIKNKDNHLVGSKLLRNDDGEIWGMGGKFDPKLGIRYMYNQKTNELGFFKKAINVDWFAGMGTTIHKSVFEKVGYLDYERFPQYHGDSDFTYMAKKSGFNLVAYPNLIIYNDVFNTGSTHDLTFKSLFYSFFDLKSKYNIKKELQFFKKHGKSIIAYNFILRKYFFYVGGFIKWKFLSIFGIQKSIN